MEKENKQTKVGRCQNPECSQKEFVRRRRNQKYCSIGCARSANNDKYRSRHAPYFDFAMQLEDQDNILEGLFEMYKSQTFNGNFLIAQGIDFSFSRLHPVSGVPEYVFLKYKLVLENKDKNNFTISKIK